jgi:hypothetical protein
MIRFEVFRDKRTQLIAEKAESREKEKQQQREIKSRRCKVQTVQSVDGAGNLKHVGEDQVDDCRW